MRLTTLRTLLLVLAMVIQTITGGAGLARAASASSKATLSAQCHALRAGEQRAPDGRPHHRHNCQFCLLCDDLAPVWISFAAYQVGALHEYVLVESPIGDTRPLLSGRSSRAHRARAPPSRA